MKKVNELTLEEREDLRKIALESSIHYCDHRYDSNKTLTRNESKAICEEVLWDCYEKFDESEGEFLHYFRRTLKFRMKFEYLKLGRMIDIPDRNLSYVKSVEAIRQDYMNRYGGVPPTEFELIHYERYSHKKKAWERPFQDLIKRSGIPAQILLDSHEAYYIDEMKVSLDEPIDYGDEDEEFTVGSMVADPVDRIAATEFLMDFQAWIETIEDPRHAQAIELKGLGHSFAEIGRELGVTGDTIKNWIEQQHQAWKEFQDSEM